MVKRQTSQNLVLWDLDGTLFDSLALKGRLFAQVFDDFPTHRDELTLFHEQNGGLNRREKIRRMGKEVLGISLSEAEIQHRSDHFSMLLREHSHTVHLAPGAASTLQTLAPTHAMYVITAMPEREARELLRSNGLLGLFSGLYGYPHTKVDAIRHVLSDHPTSSQAILLGDSYEDFAAALEADICFLQVCLHDQDKLSNKGVSVENLYGAAPIITKALSDCTH